jgi:hypothetical protein
MVGAVSPAPTFVLATANKNPRLGGDFYWRKPN